MFLIIVILLYEYFSLDSAINDKLLKNTRPRYESLYGRIWGIKPQRSNTFG